jgi:hypothetical protein
MHARVGVMRAINRRIERCLLHRESIRIGGAGVPALTGSADIATLDSLQHRRKIASRTGYFPKPAVIKPSVRTFPADGLAKQGIGLMIRYSSYGSTNLRTNQCTDQAACSLAIEYRELRDLRSG